MKKMADKMPGSISLTDQILETLFSRVEDQDGFDKEIITKLRALAERNELTDVERVKDLLKKDKGGNDETHRTGS
jgi:hypothetical protein